MLLRKNENLAFSTLSLRFNFIFDRTEHEDIKCKIKVGIALTNPLTDEQHLRAPRGNKFVILRSLCGFCLGCKTICRRRANDKLMLARCQPKAVGSRVSLIHADRFV